MPMRRHLLPLLTLLAACTLDAPVQYLVPDLRILAIRDWVGPSPEPLITSADADAGELVNLQALVANPLGRNPLTITVEWIACLPVLPFLGGPTSPCLDPARLAYPDELAASADVINLGTKGPDEIVRLDLADPLNLYGALAPTVAATLDALVIAATAAPVLRCSLFADLPVVAIARAPGVTEVALKRVRLTPTLAVSTNPLLRDIYVSNLNPTIASVDSGPGDADACTGGTPVAATLPPGAVTLCARPTSESIQVFNQCQSDGSLVGVDEQIEWQWYVSAGSIAGSDFLGNAEGNNIALTPASGASTLWVILRDRRGGADWRTLPLSVP